MFLLWLFFFLSKKKKTIIQRITKRFRFFPFFFSLSSSDDKIRRYITMRQKGDDKTIETCKIDKRRGYEIESISALKLTRSKRSLRGT